MTIRKKSLDTLKQQKQSFVNFIKTKEKYSWLIADLFIDDEIEKIDDMEWVKHHLEQKWVSKELVDALETDYAWYLRSQSFYWWMDDYPDDVKESIKENDKILDKIKKDIIKEYRDKEELLSLNVEDFVDSSFIKGENKQSEKLRDVYYWENEIEKIDKKIMEIDWEVKDIERRMKWCRYELENKNWFLKGKKKIELERKIEEQGKEKRIKEDEKKQLEKTIEDYKYNETIAEKIGKINKWNEVEIRRIIENNREYINKQGYEQAIENINNELKECLDYMPNDIILKIKQYIINIINEDIGKQKEKLKETIKGKIKEYLNYFNYGENKDLQSVKTIYSKSKIDPQIMWIINQLWIDINIDMSDNTIDYDFMDDVFIHTTGFDVLDDILEEWWLVSTNEIMKRSKYNQDIMDARTQTNAHHKDVYFSRGFRKNEYWHAKSDDDFVFIANTMSNFAERWYGVPLSDKMQPNAWLRDVYASHDIHWYSIISKSALEKNFLDDSYSKIDVKDFYIFVSETKRKEIESNSKYKIENANIIYIPKEYKWKMSYKLYEFMKKEIALRNRDKTKKTPLPRKIVTDSDGIESIGNYKWAFCDSVWDIPEVLFNPLKNWDYKTILNFLKTNKGDLRWTRIRIDFGKLEDFLSEQKNNIDNLELPFQYPRELLLLVVMYTHLFCVGNLLSYKDDATVSLINIIKEFGYTKKELWILYNTVDWISYILMYKDDKSLMTQHIKDIRTWCDDWSVDFDQIREFLINVSNISLRPYLSGLVKDVLK